MKESEFSRYLRDKLKDAGFTVDRIESHSTGVGIPDMHVVGHGDEYWIELKSMPKLHFLKSKAEHFKMPWRPGQRAWAISYMVGMLGKCSMTAVRTADAVCFIRMDGMFPCDSVPRERMINFMPYISRDARTLVLILRFMSNFFAWEATETIRSNITRWVSEFLRIDVDYDADVLWGSDADAKADLLAFINKQQEMFETLLCIWSNMNSVDRKR